MKLGIFKPDQSKLGDPADAFNGCPNRAMAQQSSHNYKLLCPKFTDGTNVMVNIAERHSVSRLATQLGCLGCPYKNVHFMASERQEKIAGLHPTIVEEVSNLYSNEHYPQAILKGWQAVRDTLREQTGFERASDAFGKSDIDVAQGAPEHLQADIHEGAKYLMMAADRFRNVSAHSADGLTSLFSDENASQVATEFMAIASLAMRFLDVDRAFISIPEEIAD